MFGRGSLKSTWVYRNLKATIKDRLRSVITAVTSAQLSQLRKAVITGLTVEQKRLIIKLRYAQLTTRPSAVAINEVINSVFKKLRYGFC